MSTYLTTYTFTDGSKATLQADIAIDDSLVTSVSLALKGPVPLSGTSNSSPKISSSYTDVPDCVNWNGVVGCAVSSDETPSLTANLKAPSGSASASGTAPGPVSVSVPV